jgi:hypothetical protein
VGSGSLRTAQQISIHGFQFLSVCGEDGIIQCLLPDESHKIFGQRRFIMDGERIIHPLGVLPVLDKAGIAQDGEMFGDRRYGQAEYGGDLTHAERLPGKHVENPQAVGIGQGFERFFEIVQVIASPGEGLLIISLLDEM